MKHCPSAKSFKKFQFYKLHKVERSRDLKKLLMSGRSPKKIMK
ncbi:hypothetical protein APA_5325 [Pseudanabaena sp. lw0831]|nr:hypothetical protein APA_5325 [Pseudanabaena sp. lw0831]